MTQPAEERKEDRIVALQAELDALRAHMQEFTATVSHDLRAPLRHITSYAQLVIEDAGPQLSTEVQGFLATIADSARHMGVMLDGLVALSRLSTAPLNIECVALAELVEEVRQEMDRQYPTRSIEWRIASELPHVMADTSLMRQVLMHVMGNAVKFTTPRDVAVIEVKFKLHDNPGAVELEIRDNGVGYNPSMQSKLFTVFGKLHSAAQFEGLGMGLALTRTIMQRAGGVVEAQGVLNEGCVVRLTLLRA